MSSVHHIRPFGPLSWILEKLPTAGPWSIIGALSAEDRCLAATQEMLRLSPETKGKLLNITPRTLGKVTRTRSLDEHLPGWERKRSLNQRRVEADLGASIEVVSAGSIVQEESRLNGFVMTLAEESPSDVILDISTMPKRYFFPLLTRLCESRQIRNLIVTNASPLRYGDMQHGLAGDADNWKPLPLYEGDSLEEPREAMLIIGVGYHPLNIQEILEENKSRQINIRMFFPFPSIHPGFIPNWKFVKHIRNHRRGPEGQGDSADIIIRVPVGDVSLTFDRLLQQTQGGHFPSLILAPYGPKPMSLAMCLLGIARRNKGTNPDTEAPNLPTTIGYTQPSWYHPDYSHDVRKTNGISDVPAFCVRLNGRDLYDLP